MSEAPRYRCALEKGFFSKPTEIYVAKTGSVGVAQRAEFGDEFEYEGPPGQWMEPINEAARQRASELVGGGKRRTVNAPTSTSYTPLKPPKASGMRAITEVEAFGSHYDTTKPDDAKPAPARRRPAKAN